MKKEVSGAQAAAAIVGWLTALIQFVVDLLKTLVGICGDAQGFFGWLLEAVRKLKKGDCSGVEGLVSKLVDIIAGFIGPLLLGVATVFGLKGIVCKVKCWVQGLWEFISKTLKKIMSVIMCWLKKLFGGKDKRQDPAATDDGPSCPIDLPSSETRNDGEAGKAPSSGGKVGCTTVKGCGALPKSSKPAPKKPVSQKKDCSSCFVAGTLVHGDVNLTPIEQLRPADHVVTYSVSDDTALRELFSPVTHRLLSLVKQRSDGSTVEMKLLRSHEWIEDYGAHVGGSVFLNMPEMGVEGLAEVVSIQPCPTVKMSRGRLVTATFKHTSGEVYDLKLASENEPISVTATHPFWSVDRNGWVSAIDLKVGEMLQTLSGTTAVESRTKRDEPETVYNIEVEGDHVYRVGESGVLVHNASIPSANSGWTPPSGWKGPDEAKWGCFSGNRGDSDFVVAASRLTTLGLSATDNVVPYRKGLVADRGREGSLS